MKIFCLLLLATALPSWADPLLHYPRHSRDSEPEAYVAELLQLAVERAPLRYRLQPSAEPMAQSRAQQMLEQHSPHLQVMWAMTTREREQRLLPIRIPIYKGLIGWRISLLRQQDAQLLSQVNNLADLKPLRFGQRHDWPDTPLLRANGLQVVTSPSYSGLFAMLQAQRFDAFPREVVTVWQEQAEARRNGLQLAVDEHVVLHYPSAFYFFTSRQDPQLAEHLRQGLEAAIADGSFERLFQKRHGETLRRARLEQRRVIELENPELPAETPFHRQELWYRPEAPSTDKE